ncbi:helix-turn-helix domain-containing protein [Thalassotalea crassostreae]|uniref:helix-turn-helix domain-containing protein n=1 Tax=Thalassotalea crassostreae TaxID=1763536 RepID=UPI00083950BE|nr:helix-turn-helix domain-containing protein [Thalassotalea crassostreae]
MLLNTNEVSDILGVDKGTLNNWRSNNTHPELKYAKLGRSVRYRREDVEKFINNLFEASNDE